VQGATDGEVIRRSLADAPAFAAIYDRHAGVVFRFLVRRVGRDTADELLGETFRIAFERRASYDVGCPVARPWLYGIASRLVSHHRRSEGRRLRAIARIAAGGLGPGAGPVATPEPAPMADEVAAGVDAARSWREMADVIALLPDGERDALLLFAWEELSYEEIAVVLEIPIGTVRSRINRARRRLRVPAAWREPDGAHGQQPDDDHATSVQPSTSTP
jgi:RNA polymerase sigma-70 factor (ECF subfamily)